MNKKVILVGLGGVMIIFGLFAAAGWVLFSGAGFVAEKAPGLVQDGRRLATEVLRRAEGAMPGVREKAEQMVPGIGEKFDSLLPGADVPEQDVSGEDIMGVDRFTGLVRTAYTRTDGKREVTYLGEVEFRSVVDFYARQLGNYGFIQNIVSATANNEIHEYRKADRMLRVVFEKQNRFGVERTKMIIADNELPRASITTEATCKFAMLTSRKRPLTM